ncbi:hypothetical protein A0J61_08940 [Choanephora cucurbitarum]|uniref:Uncharacterized protein n=1 Tax=Choanephora cucurbitarum TaxID=101091 RepID=A0A1C7N2Z9_9FUNG|nr:hypothetical protein A0J61_08940 [Choanephora cucurbitarum]
MPSKNSSVNNKKMPKKSNEAKAVKSQEKKDKPEINVTSKSSPEEILHASWSFISAYQFFHMFRAYFKLPASFSIESLEQALLYGEQLNESAQTTRESSISSEISVSTEQPSKTLAEFMTKIICPLLSTRQRQNTTLYNFDESLRQLFPDVSFFKLDILRKIDLLKKIEQAYMDLKDEDFVTYKNENFIPDDMRLEPLGTDSKGWTYWYFGGFRLYREIPIPQGKKGIDMLNSRDFTFELVCHSIESWHQTVKIFESTKSKGAAKELGVKICELALEIIGKMEAREAARLRNEAKLKKARELELVPRKRSRRLEVKFDEEAKRQKIEEEEKQREAFERIERRNRLNEEEKEKREMKIEEARLKNDLHTYLTQRMADKDITQDELASLRELRLGIFSTTTEQVRKEKMKGWVQLLENPVTAKINEQHVTFVGDSLPEAFDSILLRNTLKTYLSTLMTFRFETNLLHDIYKKLLLKNGYSNIEAFCTDLNLLFESIDEKDRNHALNLLLSVFPHAK